MRKGASHVSLSAKYTILYAFGLVRGMWTDDIKDERDGEEMDNYKGGEHGPPAYASYNQVKERGIPVFTLPNIIIPNTYIYIYTSSVCLDTCIIISQIILSGEEAVLE